MTHRGAKFGTSAVEVQVAVPQIPLPLLKQRAPTEVVSERLLQKAGGFVASIGQWGGCTFDGGVDDNIRNAVYEMLPTITLSRCRAAKWGSLKLPSRCSSKISLSSSRVRTGGGGDSRFPSILMRADDTSTFSGGSPLSQWTLTMFSGSDPGGSEWWLWRLCPVILPLNQAFPR